MGKATNEPGVMAIPVVTDIVLNKDGTLLKQMVTIQLPKDAVISGEFVEFEPIKKLGE